MILVVALTLGFLCMIGGYGFLMAVGREKLESLVRIPTTISNWFRLMAPEKTDLLIVSANELGYLARVKHVDGYFWKNGAARAMRMARVPVPSGCLAILPYNDDFTQCRFLDNTAFTGEALATARGTDRVIFVFRSAHWQVTLGGRDLSLNNTVYLNALVGVHTYIDYELEALNHEGSSLGAELAELFDSLNGFKQEVEGWVKGQLKATIEQFTARLNTDDADFRYRRVMREIPRFLSGLNAKWSALAREDAGSSTVARIARAVKLEFAAMILKPLYKSEERNLKPISDKLEDMRRDANDVDAKVTSTRHAWKQGLSNAIGKIEQALAPLAGKPIPGGGNELVPEAQKVNEFITVIKDKSDGTCNSITGLYTEDHIKALIKGAYDNLIEQLTRWLNEVEKACDEIDEIRNKMPEDRKVVAERIKGVMQQIRAQRLAAEFEDTKRPVGVST